MSPKIQPGESVVRAGPSGCGKSTTLRRVVGLAHRSGGTYRHRQAGRIHLAPKDRGVATVSQNCTLHPRLTVRDNISFGLRQGSMRRKDVDAEVARAAVILELEPLLDRQPSELSGGQRQRVAMGRASVRIGDEVIVMRAESRQEVASDQPPAGWAAASACNTSSMTRAMPPTSTSRMHRTAATR